MKKALKYFKISYFCLCFGLLIIGIGYFYLNSTLKAPVQNPTESVPYYSSAPENKGVLFDFKGSRVLLYLNFSQGSANVVFPTASADDSIETYGYPVDFTVSSDFDLLSAFVDMAGGIEIQTDGETLRYTGVQIADMMEFTVIDEELKREMALKILKGISEQGITKENLLFIIKNSNTNLTVPDCYFWTDYLPDMLRSTRIIN